MTQLEEWWYLEPPEMEIQDFSHIQSSDYSELSLLSLSLPDSAETLAEWKPLETDSKVPVLPVSALPEIYSRLITTIAENIQAPVDLVHAQALGVLAGATRGRFILDTGSWTELVTLYLASFAEPGERKSQVSAMVIKPLKDFEQDLRIERKPAVDSINEKRLLESQRLEMLRRKVASGKSTDVDLEADYQATQQRLNSCPEQFLPRLLVGDITPEALTRTMSEQNGSVSIIQPEGGLISNLNGRYSDGQPNLDLVNQAYGAEPVNVTRQGRPDIYIERPHMAIALNVQPAVLREMASSIAMTQKGFLDRFLLVKPRSLLGHRLPENDKPLDENAYLDWCTYVREIAEYATELQQKDKVITLTLSQDALVRFTAFRTSWEPRLLSELRSLSGWGSKFPGMVLRIASLFALLRNPRTTEVELGDLNSALTLVPYYVEHRKQLFPKGSTSRSENLLARLCEDGRSQFTTRDAVRLVQNQAWVSGSLEKTIIVRDVLQALSVLGKVRKLPKEGKSEQWELHPELLI
jgi:hypothetical protein